MSKEHCTDDLLKAFDQLDKLTNAELEWILEEKETQIRELEVVFDALPEAVFVYHGDGDLIYCNEEGRRWLELNAVDQTKPAALRFQEGGYRTPEGQKIDEEEAPLKRCLTYGVVIKDFVMRQEKETGIYDSWSAAPLRNSQGEITGAVVTRRDITADKRAELELRESEEKLRTILENSRDGIVLLDLKNGKYLFQSKAYAEMTGFTIEDLPSTKEIFSRIHPEDQAGFFQQFQRLHDGESQGYDWSFRWLTKRGEYRWFNNRTRMIRDPQGHPKWSVIIVRDITEAKEMENELRDSEQRLKMAVAAGQLGIFDNELETGRIIWNEAYYRILGYQPGEVEPHLSALFERIHPEDRPAMIETVEGNIRRGGEFLDEFRTLWSDGSVHWIEERGVVQRNDAGSLTRVFGVARDITAQKRQMDERYNNLLESAPFPIIIARIRDGTLRYGNQRAKVRFGFSGEEGIGLAADQFYRIPAERQILLEGLSREGSVYDQLVHLLDYHGRPYTALMSATLVQYEGEAAVLASVNDITARIEAEEALRQSEEKYRMIAENTSDVIWVRNLTTQKLTYISPSVQQLRGYTVEEALAQTLEEVVTPESFRTFSESVARTLPQFLENPQVPMSYTIELQQPCKSGEIVWVEVSAKYRLNPEGEVEVVGVTRDIRERKKKDEELNYIGLHDPQTGLLNQFALRTMTREAALQGQLRGTRSAIILNLDNFRVINEAMGHSEGDRTIAEIARSILARVGDRGEVYRNGGDEFTVIVCSAEFADVYDLAKSILDGVSTQMYIANRLISLTASIGVCLGKHEETVEQIIKNADTALFIAKKQKNTIRVYNPTMEQARTREIVLEEDMSSALEKGEFELYFQPIINVKHGVIDQAEALLRWNHPTFGLVPPGEFIPIAERTRLILPISDWIIRQACQHLAQWKALGVPKIALAINLSPLSFERRGNKLVEQILYTIDEYGINPASLKLEITESMLINEPEEIAKVFRRLKEAGVRLALDDFGTGYSSFGYLMDIPLDIMKLDRSLINAIDAERKGRQVVQSLIAIVHGMELEVVAEGVETVSQFTFLKNSQCNYVQGYLFSRPLTNRQFIEYCLAMKEPGKVWAGIKGNHGV